MNSEQAQEALEATQAELDRWMDHIFTEYPDDLPGAINAFAGMCSRATILGLAGGADALMGVTLNLAVATFNQRVQELAAK